MEQLEMLKETLVASVQKQVYGGLDQVNAEELGEVIDMIKDLAETMYYCTITEAMHKDEHYGTTKQEDYPAMNGARYYVPGPMERYPMENRRHDMDTDPREGRSGKRRRMYMESKQMGYDKARQMHELEEYMQELTQDITEMISDITPEEKTMLQQKIATLASKIK